MLQDPWHGAPAADRRRARHLARSHQAQAGEQLPVATRRRIARNPRGSTSPCSAAPTRSAKHGRSKRCTAQRPKHAPWSSHDKAGTGDGVGAFAGCDRGLWACGRGVSCAARRCDRRARVCRGYDLEPGARRAGAGRIPPASRWWRTPTRCCATCRTSTCSSSRRRTASTSLSHARRSRARSRSSWTSRSPPTRRPRPPRRGLRGGGRAVHGLSEPPLGRRLPDGPAARRVRRARRDHALRVALRALPAAGRRALARVGRSRGRRRAAARPRRAPRRPGADAVRLPAPGLRRARRPARRAHRSTTTSSSRSSTRAACARICG